MEAVFVLALLFIMVMMVFQGIKYVRYQLPGKIKSFLSKPKNLLILFVTVLFLLVAVNPDQNGDKVLPVIFMIAIMIWLLGLLKKKKWF